MSKSPSSTIGSPKLINLTLRDGQQSTLDAADWLLDSCVYAKVVAASQQAGFDGVEISGGQSFQIAIGNGYNPFTILSSVSQALRHQDSGNDFELQMLFRGANALGFRHYDQDLLEVTLKEFIKCGITKIRCFDALNDIDNLTLPESVKATPGLTLEGAICFTHYSEAPERYQDDYFCRYAEALIEAGYNAIAIKDMSGQLTAERVDYLVPALLEVLKPLGVPLALHCHSTDAARSRGAIQQALHYGIAAIETVEGSLSGGSSHHPLAELAPELIKNRVAYEQLGRRIDQLWGSHPGRKDKEIAPELKEKLCAAGVPGGAMPFVIRDLKQQEPTIRAKYASSMHSEEQSQPVESFADVVDLFLAELKQVCQDAGLPLLVTPTADICCKQAIANLAFGSDPYSGELSERYLSRSGQPNPDPRFAKLILGYYGELKAYDGSGKIHGPNDEVLLFFQANNAQQLNPIKHHPSMAAPGGDLREAQQSAWSLIQRKGASVLSFASFDQLTILYALRPAGSHASNDPIEQAMGQYVNRSELAKIDGRGQTFPGYQMLMQPILDYLSADFILNPRQQAGDVIQKPLHQMGRNLCCQLFDVYNELPVWAQANQLMSNLTKLLSSEHIRPDLLEGVRHVSESLVRLDLRPSRQERSDLSRALARFEQLTIAELFHSLALINSFVNGIAKHATNPTYYAQRSIGFTDLKAFIERSQSCVKASLECPWEDHLQQSITGKYIRLKNDLISRSASWTA
jgi:oxaloacetate decarboxylase alpha subunit